MTKRTVNTEFIDKYEFDDIKEFKDCIFCKPPAKKVLVETTNFYVTYDACALLDGHVEIHTKDHIGCSAEIGLDELQEFIRLKKWTGDLIKDVYGCVSFYEHGRAGHCSMTVDGVLCHHFHMHALPLQSDISDEVTKLVKPIIIESEEEVPALYERYDQYLYFENTEGKKFFFPVNKPIPSHYLRTVIAESINHPERADWEHYFDVTAVNNFKHELATKKITYEE